jgi:hypothetical protein
VTAKAYLVTGRGSLRANAARSSRIAGVRFAVEPGRSATIRFRLTKRARGSLRRRGQLAATLEITARHGTQVRARMIRLKLIPKRRR